MRMEASLLRPLAQANDPNDPPPVDGRITATLIAMPAAILAPNLRAPSLKHYRRYRSCTGNVSNPVIDAHPSRPAIVPAGPALQLNKADPHLPVPSVLQPVTGLHILQAVPALESPGNPQ